MSIPAKRTNSLVCRTLGAIALAAWCGTALAAEPAAKQAAALHACSQRAELLFVRKCVQACMIDSKTKTRVMQESFDRDTCQQRCGHQPELPSFVASCMKRAGYVAPAEVPAS